MNNTARVPDEDNGQNLPAPEEASAENAVPTSLAPHSMVRNGDSFQTWLEHVRLENLQPPAELPKAKSPEGVVTEIRRLLEGQEFQDSTLFSAEELLRGILDKQRRRLPLGLTLIGGRSTVTPDSSLVRAEVQSPEGNALIYSGLPSPRGKAQSTHIPTPRESAVMYDDSHNGEMTLVLCHTSGDFPADIEVAKLSAVSAAHDLLVGRAPKENRMRVEEIIEDLLQLGLVLHENDQLGLRETAPISVSFVRLSKDNVLEIVQRGKQANLVLVIDADGNVINWQRKYVDTLADAYGEIDGKEVPESKRREVYDRIVQETFNTPYKIPVEPGTRVMVLPASSRQILETQFREELGEKVHEPHFDFNERFQRYVGTYVLVSETSLQHQAEGLLEHQRGLEQTRNNEPLFTSYTVAALEVPKKD